MYINSHSLIYIINIITLKISGVYNLQYSFRACMDYFKKYLALHLHQMKTYILHNMGS